jgi:hypothetical protein
MKIGTAHVAASRINVSKAAWCPAGPLIICSSQ